MLPISPAAKLQLIHDLMFYPVHDENTGEFLRYEETGLISVEQVRKLLELEDE